MSAKESEKIIPAIDVCEKCYNISKDNEGVMKRIDFKRFRCAQTNSNKNFCALCGILLDDNLDDSYPKKKEKKAKPPENYLNMVLHHKKILLFVILMAAVVILLKLNISHNQQPVGKINVAEEMENLKAKYSKQNKALWQNVRKIVGDTEDSVHSFVLLYKNNSSAAAECFAKDLIQVINKMHDISEVVIYKSKKYVLDYGEELNDYLNVVKQSKHMIVPKLQKISGDTARIFHTLCDVGQHSVKPSYFIFTLEDTSNEIAPDLQMKNPLVRVGSILRKIWSNLADNELHPLISRIVRNVAEISEFYAVNNFHFAPFRMEAILNSNGTDEKNGQLKKNWSMVDYE